MSELPPSTPRWVLAFGIVVGILVIVFVLVHLAGGGFQHVHG